MSATYITKAIEQLQSNIFMHVRHRALLQNTGNPIVDLNQLFFIQLPHLNESVSMQNDVAAATVGIVHASLAEHDQVLEFNATSKEQQLTVLAGDYYSGRYYQLLANIGDIALIGKLSEGIVERCEQQIVVYENTSKTAQQIVESIQVVESKLIEKFYESIDVQQFVPLMQKALTILRLRRELVQLQSNMPSRYGQLFLKAMPDEGDLVQYITNVIQTFETDVITLLEQSDFIKQDIKQYILDHFINVSKVERF